MKPVRLRILSLWTGFDEADNWISDLLMRHFPIEFSDEPDFVIFSEKSAGWEQHGGVRIFYTPENVRPGYEAVRLGLLLRSSRPPSSLSASALPALSPTGILREEAAASTSRRVDA